MMCAIAFAILQWAIVRRDGKQSLLATAVGGGYKEKLSIVLYAAGIVCAFFVRHVSLVLYVAVALMWLIPDRRIERVATEHPVEED
jgi:uncharacterized membrane protein